MCAFSLMTQAVLVQIARLLGLRAATGQSGKGGKKDAGKKDAGKEGANKEGGNKGGGGRKRQKSRRDG
jgi:hypothetical protein